MVYDRLLRFFLLKNMNYKLQKGIVMDKKLLFIYNPRSGKGAIRNHLADIIDIFVKGNYEVTAYPTQGHLDGMRIAIEEGGHYDLVVCCGGDGTLDEVLSGLARGGHPVKIGYIPAGSTNDFANSLNLPKSMTEAAQNIVDGNFCQFDLGYMNEMYFVYVAAFGIFTEVSYATNQDLKNILGHVAYLLKGMQCLLTVKSYRIKVTGRDISFDGDFILGMITNSTSVGGFKNLTGKNVKMDDGLFEATFIRRPKNPIELQEIVSALLMEEDNTALIESFKTDFLTIECKDEIPWTIDGEFGGEFRQTEIQNLKHAASIAVIPEKTIEVLDA